MAKGRKPLSAWRKKSSRKPTTKAASPGVHRRRQPLTPHTEASLQRRQRNSPTAISSSLSAAYTPGAGSPLPDEPRRAVHTHAARQPARHHRRAALAADGAELPLGQGPAPGRRRDHGDLHLRSMPSQLCLVSSLGEPERSSCARRRMPPSETCRRPCRNSTASAVECAFQLPRAPLHFL
jgi:hypothetical protein